MDTLDFPKETYKSMYEMMLRIRMVEEKIAELYPEQEMRCPVHLCIGQEAVAVGVCANLTVDDYVLGSLLRVGLRLFSRPISFTSHAR